MYSGGLAAATNLPCLTLQEVRNEAIKLAAGYGDAAYTKAAEELRFPFFDWGLNDGSGSLSDDLLDAFFNATVEVPACQRESSKGWCNQADPHCASSKPA